MNKTVAILIRSHIISVMTLGGGSYSHPSSLFVQSLTNEIYEEIHKTVAILIKSRTSRVMTLGGGSYLGSQ